MDEKVSVIIPSLDDGQVLSILFAALMNQSRRPDEVIVVDSSSDDEINALCSNYEADFKIKYFRVAKAYKFDRWIATLKNFFHFGKSNLRNGKFYPSEATNFGINEASGSILALLDVSTIPKPNWLKDYLKTLIEGNYDVVFGATVYSSKTITQENIHLSTFGKRIHETNPGSLIWKKAYLNNRIIEGFRAGVDLEWRTRIKEVLKWHSPQKDYLEYISLPYSLWNFLKKMFIYQIHSAPLRIQQNSKDLASVLTLGIATLVLTRWNYIVGWESDLYIPHITKIILLCINIFLIQIIALRRIGFNILSRYKFPLVNNLLIIIFFFSIFLLSYRWNAVIAGWVESSRFYIPHLTKLVIFSFLFTLIIYRGLIFPLKNLVALKQLLPLRFISIGIYGAAGDLAKMPGFIMGAIYTIFIGRNKK